MKQKKEKKAKIERKKKKEVKTKQSKVLMKLFPYKDSILKNLV